MEEPIQPEQRLWLAVIAQAVKDAMHKDERRERVISWTATRDYIEICIAVGICPVILRKWLLSNKTKGVRFTL